MDALVDKIPVLILGFVGMVALVVALALWVEK